MVKCAEIYDNGFKPAIERAGYIPMRIDTKDDVVKIDDAIIQGNRLSGITQVVSSE